jgi:hypothetical protein
MSEHEADGVTFRVAEPAATPPLSVLLGWGAMLPFLPGVAATWLLHDRAAALASHLTLIWGGAILAFLAGVRRGLSFRTPGGPDAAQIVTMLWLFLLALAALVSPWPQAAAGALILGYGTMAVLDPLAAHRREVPLFFARLRPVQMLIPILSLAAIFLRLWLRS